MVVVVMVVVYGGTNTTFKKHSLLSPSPSLLSLFLLFFSFLPPSLLFSFSLPTLTQISHFSYFLFLFLFFFVECLSSFVLLRTIFLLIFHCLFIFSFHSLVLFFLFPHCTFSIFSPFRFLADFLFFLGFRFLFNSSP